MNPQDLDNWRDIIAKLRTRTSHQVFNERVAVEMERMIAALAPPQTPMTDEQIKRIWCSCRSINNEDFALEYTRAVERYHGIGPARGE
jgi:hypothetical protein